MCAGTLVRSVLQDEIESVRFRDAGPVENQETIQNIRHRKLRHYSKLRRELFEVDSITGHESEVL